MGQRFLSGPTLGYGSKDHEQCASIARFINNHLMEGHRLLVCRTSDLPSGIVESQEKQDV